MPLPYRTALKAGVGATHLEQEVREMRSDAPSKGKIGHGLDVAARLIESERAGSDLTWNSSAPRPPIRRPPHPGDARNKLWSGC